MFIEMPDKTDLTVCLGSQLQGRSLRRLVILPLAFRVGEAEAERASNVFCSSRDPSCWNSDTHIQGGLPTSTEPAWKHSHRHIQGFSSPMTQNP